MKQYLPLGMSLFLLVFGGGCAQEQTKAKASPKTFIEVAQEKKRNAAPQVRTTGLAKQQSNAVTELLYIKGDQVNIRAQPSVKSEIRAVLKQGHEVEVKVLPAVEAEGFTWKALVWPTGEAWVAQRFLSTEKPISNP